MSTQQPCSRAANHISDGTAGCRGAWCLSTSGRPSRRSSPSPETGPERCGMGGNRASGPRRRPAVTPRQPRPAWGRPERAYRAQEAGGCQSGRLRNDKVDCLGHGGEHGLWLETKQGRMMSRRRRWHVSSLVVCKPSTPPREIGFDVAPRVWSPPGCQFRVADSGPAPLPISQSALMRNAKQPESAGVGPDLHGRTASVERRSDSIVMTGAHPLPPGLRAGATLPSRASQAPAETPRGRSSHDEMVACRGLGSIVRLGSLCT